MAKSLEDILKTISDPRERQKIKEFFDKLVDQLGSPKEAIRQLNEELNTTTSTVSELRGSIEATVTGLTNQREATNNVRKGFRQLYSIAVKLEDTNDGTYKLSLKELRALKDRAKGSISLIEKQKESLEQKERELKAGEALSSADAEALAAARSKLENERLLVDRIDERIKKEEEVVRKLGIGGGLLKSAANTLKKLGIEGTVLDEALSQANEQMENLAEDGKSSFSILKGGAKSLGTSITKSLVTDPVVGAGLLANAFLAGFSELNKGATETTRLVGDLNVEAAALNTRFASTTDVLAQINVLTKEIGINAQQAFTKDTLAAAAELQNTLGVSAEEAGRLAITSKLTNKTFDSSVETIVDQVSAFNRSNKAAVNQRLVLEDVAQVGDDILASFAAQPGALATAAASARRLGLSLKEIDSVASSLLNFESSIEAELEAQLLTGRNLNLARARELALVNDLEGVGQEIFSNSASILEFSQMNRIAQEGQARALGLTREQLGKIAIQRGIEAGLSEQALASAAGMTLEQFKSVQASEAFSKSVEKIQQALAGPAQIIASILSNTTALSAVMTTIAAFKFTQLIAGIVSLTMSLTGAATAAGALKAFTNPVALGIGLASLAGLGLLINSQVKKAQQIKDGVIDPSGGLVVSGQKGSFQLDKDDYVTASPSPMVGANNANNSALIERIDRLIQVVKEGGDVFLDSNKVGNALVLGTYRNR